MAKNGYIEAYFNKDNPKDSDKEVKKGSTPTNTETVSPVLPGSKLDKICGAIVRGELAPVGVYYRGPRQFLLEENLSQEEILQDCYYLVLGGTVYEICW